MSLTDNLKKQHIEIIEIKKQVEKYLDPSALKDYESRVHDLLISLQRELEFHFKREDEALYPALFRHPKEAIRVVARKYFDEIGGTNELLTEYAAKWSDAVSIQENHEEFIADTKSLFNALETRISKEDNELYPLLDLL